MSYLQLTAPQLFTGNAMLTGKALITTKNGEVKEIINTEDCGEQLQYFDGILSPGFVNAHCHLELSHMRGIAQEKTGLVNFLLEVITKRNADENVIQQAIINAENEMLQNGIVAIGDISNTTHTITQKAKNNLRYYNFIEALGWSPEFAQQSYNNIKTLYDEFINALGANSTSLVPHAPYTVSQELWKLLQPSFAGKIISIHNQETPGENELFMHGTGDFLKLYAALGLSNNHFIPPGKTSLQSYLHNLFASKKILLVHNTTTSNQDMAFADKLINNSTNQLYYCLCPNANLYIENTLPRVDHLIKNNCKMVLGTDSLTSNHALNILTEIKTLHENFKSIPLESLLQWATINGAEALGMNDAFGSFDTGKTPGVISVSTDLNTVKRII